MASAYIICRKKSVGKPAESMNSSEVIAALYTSGSSHMAKLWLQSIIPIGLKFDKLILNALCQFLQR